jgi:hypothetical protein
MSFGLDSLTPYTFNLGLQIIQQYRYSPHFTLHCCKHTKVLSLHSPLATDSWQSHCHFKSHMKSSLHSLIHFLPFLLNHSANCKLRRLDSILVLAVWDPHRTLLATPLLLLRDITAYVLTQLLHSNGCMCHVSWHLLYSWVQQWLFLCLHSFCFEQVCLSTISASHKTISVTPCVTMTYLVHLTEPHTWRSRVSNLTVSNHRLTLRTQWHACMTFIFW